MNESAKLLPQKYMEGDKVHVLGIDVSRGKYRGKAFTNNK